MPAFGIKKATYCILYSYTAIMICLKKLVLVGEFKVPNIFKMPIAIQILNKSGGFRSRERLN